MLEVTSLDGATPGQLRDLAARLLKLADDRDPGCVVPIDDLGVRACNCLGCAAGVGPRGLAPAAPPQLRS